MTWVRLDDAFFHHTKVMRVGKDGMLLFLASLCYCSSGSTDGYIDGAVVRKLAALAEVEDVAAATGRLLTVGMWERDGDGYRVHDYLKYNPSAEQVRELRAEGARRQAEWRARRNGQSNGVTDDVTHAGRHA